MNKYRILEVIGDGTYGTVYKGINTETNEKVAIKKLKAKVKSINECMNMNEVKIVKKCNHENIIKLYEIIHEQNNDVSYIFEYADTNLYEYMSSFKKNNQSIPEHKIKNIVFQIIAGINYLHQHGIIHRDLKPENILMMNDSNLIKIADFGVAKETSYNGIPMTDYVCTRWYRAPECVLKSTSYSYSIDVWAIGCIMAELYNLKPLFPGISEFDQLTKITNVLGTPNFADWPDGFKLIQKLGMKFPVCAKGTFPFIIRGASQDALSMIEDILQWDSKSRPSCEMLMKSNFFNEVRPGTYSFPSRYGRNLDSSNNNNAYNNNTYRKNGNELNSNFDGSETEKHANYYLRNLNFRNYQKNGGVIPDIDSAFHRKGYINNAGYILSNNNGFNNNMYNNIIYNNRKDNNQIEFNSFHRNYNLNSNGNNYFNMSKNNSNGYLLNNNFYNRIGSEINTRPFYNKKSYGRMFYNNGNRLYI